MKRERIRNLTRRDRVIAAGSTLVLAGFVGGTAVAVTGLASADGTSEGRHGNAESLTGEHGFGHPAAAITGGSAPGDRERSR